MIATFSASSYGIIATLATNQNSENETPAQK